MIAGAIGGDLRTTGEYVATVQGAHMLTHLGPIPFPPGESYGLLFPKQTTRGPWKFAGKAHDAPDGATWEWDGAWTKKPPSNGENGFAYTADGTLHIIAPGKDVTSQGFRRNGDASLSMGDMVYGPWKGLNEYADLEDGLFIGQGAEEHGTVTGICLWDVNANVNRLLVRGLCTFITVDRVGDAVALSYCVPGGVEFVQTTMTALRLLPVIPSNGPSSPSKTPDAVPPPQQPTPEPKPMTNQIETVKRVRAGYPTPLGPTHPFFLIEVAKATGAKLLRKDGGTHVTLPNGVNVSQDILMFGDQGVDILGDGEGAATPGWGEKGTIAGDYIDVSGMGLPAPVPVPVPTQPPTQPTVDLGPLLERLAANDRRIDALEAVIGALTASVEALKQPKRYRVVGSTGRTYGHAHSVNVELQEIV